MRRHTATPKPSRKRSVTVAAIAAVACLLASCAEGNDRVGLDGTQSPPTAATAPATGAPSSLGPSAGPSTGRPTPAGQSARPSRAAATPIPGGRQTPTSTRSTSPPAVNTPPRLDPSFGLVNGTGSCVSPSDAIKVIATAADSDGIAQVTGSFHLRQPTGGTVFSPPTRMTLKSNGIYVYPNIDLRAGTYTLTVAATDTTGLARTATAEVLSTPTTPGTCSISSPGWAFSP